MCSCACRRNAVIHRANHSRCTANRRLQGHAEEVRMLRSCAYPQFLKGRSGLQKTARGRNARKIKPGKGEF